MKKFLKKTKNKFQYAFRGFYIILREEKSLWVHLVFTGLVITAGLVLGVSMVDWMILTLTISVVIGFEIINTGIEYLADLISFKYDLNAKKIKDLGAAATLFNSFAAVTVGLLVFIPHIINLFQGA